MTRKKIQELEKKIEILTFFDDNIKAKDELLYSLIDLLEDNLQNEKTREIYIELRNYNNNLIQYKDLDFDTKELLDQEWYHYNINKIEDLQSQINRLCLSVKQ